MAHQTESSITRLLINGACLVAIIAGLKLSASVLGPILLALFVVLAVSPLVGWLQARRVPDWLAYLLVVTAVVLLGLLLIGFLGLSVGQLSAALPSYRSLFEDQLDQVANWLDSRGIEGKDLLELNPVTPSGLFQWVLGFITGLLGTLSNIGLTLFIFIYMLVGASSFGRKLHRGLGTDNPLLQRLEVFGRSISVYLLIKTWLGAMAAIGQTLLLLLLGVDFALLWGVLSFLFNYVPNIGYVIALVPPLVLALLQYGLGKAVIVFVGYALINNFFDMVLGPRYLGKGLDLSTLVTFLAVIFWAWIFGAIGAFMALPLTVMLKKLVLESYTDSQLLARLMAADDDTEAV